MKRFLMLVLLLIAVAITPICAMAETEGDFTYSVLNDTECRIDKYTGADQMVEIPAEIGGYTVKSISANAFKGNTAITKVTMPDTIESMGDAVFASCTNLKEATLSAGLTVITRDTFDYCIKLENVTIHEGIKSVYSYAFDGCTSLKSLKLPDSIEIMSANAFRDCTSLESVNYPKNWKNVYSYNDRTSGYGYEFYTPFAGCSSLKSITIPEGVTTIPVDAFKNMSSLEEVIFSSTVKTIGNVAFLNTALKNVVLNDALTTIGESAFAGCSRLQSIYLGESLTEIGGSAFSGCSSLEGIEIPAGVATIYAKTFNNCTKLENLTLSEGLKTIHAYAFQNCTSLKSVKLPDSIEIMSASTFESCTALESVNFPLNLRQIFSTNSSVNGYGYEFYTPFSGCTNLKTIEIPEGVTNIPTDTFKSMGSLESVTFSSTVKTIGNLAFHKTSLKNVVLNDGIKTIGEEAFSSCSKLQSIYLGESLTELGGSAFSGCSSLEGIEIPAGVATIYANTFYNCKKLENLTLSEGLKTIHAYAFQNCTSLKSVKLPDSVEVMSASTFESCTALESVNFPLNLRQIFSTRSSVNGYEYEFYTPFSGCTNLKTIEIPEGATVIPAYAFRDLSSLEEVTFSSTVKSIGKYAFAGTKLKNVVLNDSVVTIGALAFTACSELVSVDLGESLTELGGSAFSGCSSLEAIEIPAGVATIYDNTFNNCTKLETVTLSEGLKTIRLKAFQNCTAIKSLKLPDSIEIMTANAFKNCTGLESVNYPKNWKIVYSCNDKAEDYAFEYYTPFTDCTNLKSIEIPEGVTGIPAYAFRSMSSLEEVTFGSTVTNIGSLAFGGTSLKNIELNDGITTIGAEAFSGCASLTSVGIPNSATSFGNNVFAGCPQATIYCYSASNAHYMAENNGYNYYLLDDHTHLYELAVQKLPECTKSGSNTYSCSICGYTYTDILEPLGHGETTRKVVSEVSCTIRGEVEFHCSVCGSLVEREITPALGHNYGEFTVEPTCTEQGYTLHGCNRCEEGYKDNYVDKKGHSFGDWVVQKEATVYAEGVKIRECGACTETETKSIEKLYIDISQNPNYGLVNFTVVNAKTGEAVPGAHILLYMDEEEVLLTTDDLGKLSQILPVGKIDASVYASGYMVRNLSIAVSAGEQDLPLIGISTEPLVNAEITSREMTYEEIIEAGIDVNDEANNHVYKYEIKFAFKPEVDILSLVAYFNSYGQLVGFGNNEDEDSGGSDDGELSPDDGEPEYSLHYHLSEVGCEWSHGWCKTVEVEKDENVYLHYKPYRDDAEDFIFDAWYEDPYYTKKISHVKIEEYNTTVYGRWIPKNQGDQGSVNTGSRLSFKTKLSDGTPVEIYPVSETFYLVIYGEVKWLKEMYHIQLVAVNNSTTDTVEDCVATLQLPYGLSLAKMVTGDQSLIRDIGHLNYAGQEGSTKTVNWYVKGDAEGYYDVTAKLTGKLMPFEEEFSYEYTAADPIKVYAGSAMHMTIEAPGVTYYNDDYVVKITLENVSDKPIYGLSHAITGLQQCRVTTYSDGSETKQMYVNQGFVGEHRTDIFNPGDKMVVELTTNIKFESELVQYQIDKLTEVVDGVERLLKGYNLFNKGANYLGDISSFVTGAHKGIEKVISSDKFDSKEQSQAYSKLYESLSKLIAKVKKGDSKAIRAYDELKKTGAIKFIEEMADSEKFYNAYSTVEVLRMTDSIEAILKSMAVQEEKRSF